MRTSEVDRAVGDAIHRLLRRQDGVVSRRQVRVLGADDVFIARMLGRRVWARVHEGVFVNHTGPLTRRQRQWAAVLLHAPAVLAGRSALACDGIGSLEPTDPIDLAVDRSRRVDDPPGVRTVQVRDLETVARMTASPPRMTIEHASVMVASKARTEDATVAALADVVRTGRTTPARLAAVVHAQPRLPRRRLMLDVLTDVGAGAHSPLELRYLRGVERAHGLPVGERQVREVLHQVADEAVRVVYRDIRYAAFATDVELDGRLGHEAALDRWADLDRDLLTAIEGGLTLRAGWQQVLATCRLALLVGGVLQSRGWSGPVLRCGETCPVVTEVPARIA
jgi:hypothetical protein